jgi:hypothetical protein
MSEVIYVRASWRLKAAVKRLAELRKQSVNELVCDVLAVECEAVPKAAAVLAEVAKITPGDEL